MPETDTNPWIDPSEIRRAERKLKAVFQKCNIGFENLVVVGSVALGIEIRSSDIDFAVGTSHVKEEVLSQLSQWMEFRGERPATPTSTRLLFCIMDEGRHIDLNVMSVNDLKLLQANLYAAAAQLSIQDRKLIIRRKTELRDKKRERELDEYKTELYRRFCPSFVWSPDDEIVKALAEEFSRRGDPIPDWLAKKLAR
ncbi:hypothetical protein [Rhizobium paknamense]|uniref:Nucleotidyltransferase domain-containing protein n=1 Tax=Rhizobium paknamense TaxID=1206817 RepID=A0ABU0IJK3_9HYPH|nr:hypothetical protein [Rhizobium paknamense]MDQ0458351.1 hypothetical protein [Rhizobium paknamense]